LLLNRHASHVAIEAAAHALTDVTGFGLVGHALEVADHSKVELRISFASLPLLPGALEYATAGVDFGGVNRNREQLGPRAKLDPALGEIAERLLFDPQTSGGLLMAVAPDKAEAVVAGLQKDGYAAAIIGDVHEGSGVTVTP
jgi:selenide,water dikinase